MSEVVLIAHAPAGGLPVTVGTGFLVSLNARIFVVTCRHVINSLEVDRISAIPCCRKHVFARKMSETLSLKNPTFHPRDDGQFSHDLAAYEVFPECNELSGIRAIPYELLSYDGSIAENTAIVISGYSVAYLSQHFDPSADQILLPERIRAVVRNIPLHQLKISGFVHAIRNIEFAHASTDIGAGVSGGPIYRESN